MDDQAVVSWQLGRPARPFAGVAVRCRYGFPAVTEQPPFGPDGRPFPTTYYLTCPWLVPAIARLEAAGGVERWTRAAADDPELRRSVEHATEEQRAVRRELAAGEVGTDGGDSLSLGIGGASRPARLKCLHAHVAFALARPGYDLGDRILAEVEPLWPDSCCTLPS